jgi:hypothetical protein
VKVTFGSDETAYAFPEEVLMDKFKYFSSALQRNNDGPVFVEGKIQAIHIHDVTARSFARLFKWVQADLGVFHDCGTISHLLQAIIAADYLGLEKRFFTGFENYVIERLAVVLLQDRRKLIPTYLDLVETHSAFRNKKIWRFFGKAGVRPFLQEFMKEEPDKETDFGAITSGDTIPRRGHPQQEACWKFFGTVLS